MYSKIKYYQFWRTAAYFLKLDVKRFFKSMPNNIIQVYYRNKVDRLIKERNKFRKAKKFKEADEIKAFLTSVGIKIKDKENYKSIWYI